jgi:hypothetical protein
MIASNPLSPILGYSKGYYLYELKNYNKQHIASIKLSKLKGWVPQKFECTIDSREVFEGSLETQSQNEAFKIGEVPNINFSVKSKTFGKLLVSFGKKSQGDLAIYDEEGKLLVKGRSGNQQVKGWYSRKVWEIDDCYNCSSIIMLKRVPGLPEMSYLLQGQPHLWIRCCGYVESKNLSISPILALAASLTYCIFPNLENIWN